MKRAWKYFLALILCSLAMGINRPSSAQSIQGTILGTVTDTTGAVIPKATVKVINRDTSFTRTVTTDDTGHYRVPSLEPGHYSVAASFTGFNRWESDPFLLNANQIQRIDVKLEAGNARTTVTVNAQAGSAVATETATLSNVHSSAEFTELPMSVYGRSAFNLTVVTAGVQSTSGIEVNGARDTANSYTIDGVGKDDVVSSRQAPNNLELSIDGLQEIKVQTANNSAEYNQVANFIAVSKAGGNQIHGSVFWGNFNSYFSSRDFFDHTSQKPSFTNNNEFAATLGGPIVIPKLYNGKDKTFFFFSYGGQRYRIGARSYGSVPTDAFRNGDFSALLSPPQGVAPIPILDPQNGFAAFPGNIIPSNRISGVSKALQDMLYPEPNLPGTGDYGVANNYTFDPGGQFNSDVYSFRVDQKISDRNTMFVRVGVTQHNQDHYPGFLKNGLDGGYFGNIPGRFLVISDTHSFSPTVVNEVRFGNTRMFYQDLYGAPLGPDYVGMLGLQGIANPSNNDFLNALPAFSFSRFNGTSGAWVSRQAQNTYEATDNLTWMRGRHTFKFGGDIRRYLVNDAGFSGSQTGSFSFNDAISGFDYASFLLGYPTNTSLSTPRPSAYPRSTIYGFYAQDDLKVSPKLTINYGLRYLYQSPWTNKYDRRYAFDPSTGSMVVASSTMPTDLVPDVAATLPIETASQAGFPVHSLMQSDWNNWNPRIGIAYRPFGDKTTVVRAGYGWYTQVWPGLLGLRGTGGPWQTDRSFNYQGTGSVPTQSFPDPFTQSTSFQAVTNISVVNPGMVNERTSQWNVSIGREFLGTAIDVAYVGTKGTRIPVVENLNLLPPSTQKFDPNVRPYPYPRFGTISEVHSRASSIYHGFTFQATRRFKNGLSFNVNYTYSKSLTDSRLNGYAPGIQQNQYDLRLERAPDPAIRPQRLIFDYMYHLPFGRGQRFFPNMNPVVNAVLGGWEVLGITTMLKGQYLSPSFSGTDPANTNQFGGRPDCVGNGNIGGIGDLVRAGLPMFNRNAFQTPPQVPDPSDPTQLIGRGSYGNCARSVLFGPGRNLWNAGLTKNFMLHEGVRLQIQWELFNAWNHANFGNGNTNISSGSFGITSSGGGGRKMLFGGRIDF